MSAPPSSSRRPSLWVIAGSLSRRQYWMFAAVGLLVPFALWAAFAASGWVDAVFLPGPLRVFERLSTWLLEDDLLTDAGISIYRVVGGFVLSAALALPIGLLIGAAYRTTFDRVAARISAGGASSVAAP